MKAQLISNWFKIIGKITILLSLVLNFQVGFSATNIVITNTEKSELIGTRSYFFEDETGTLKIDEILTPDNQKEFQLHNNDVFSRPANKSTFWFKITVQNETEEDLWLEVGSTYAWYIDFFAPDDSGKYTNVIETGTMRPDESKIYDVNLFWLPINKACDKKAKTYYLKIKSGLTYELPLSVGTIRSLNRNKDIYDFLTAGFVGLVLIMFLYNAFVYFSIRDNIYLYYLGYLLLMLFSMPYANNYPFIQEINFWFFDKQWWNTYFLFWHPFVYFFIGTFCIRYLHLAEHSKIAQRIIQVEIIVLAGIFPLLTLLGFEFIELVNVIQVIILVFYLTCLVTGYYVAIKKVKQATYYVLGWTFMVTGAFVFFAVINGFLPFNPYTRNALYFGTALEIWMFSLALGNRLNILQQEKELIQSENIRLINEQKTELEKKVKQRTIELEEKNIRLAESNEELKITTEQLDSQSKLLKEINETKDKLFAIIGHDLQSPLVTLGNLVEIADDKLLNDPKLSKLAGKLKKDIDYLHLTLQNLLHWALNQMKGIKVNKQDFALKGISDEILTLIREVAHDKDIKISNNIDKDLKVNADPDQIRIVFRNLIYNAIKFTPQGGAITINARTIDEWCEISIVDTGIGIEPETAADFFNTIALESTSGTAGEKGTGLGLVLCKDFVPKNNGKIRVESKKGEGSTFYFTLPIVQS